ncbi:MAG: hypothetical protein AAGF94_03215 [Pseudomonadota bacterium]
MKQHRSSFGAIAALILLLGSIGSGFAHGQAPAAGWTTLCIGNEIVVTAVDENGQPVSPGHICPKCIVLFLPGSPAAPRLEAPASDLREKPLPVEANHKITRAAAPPARAPPQSI